MSEEKKRPFVFVQGAPPVTDFGGEGKRFTPAPEATRTDPMFDQMAERYVSLDGMTDEQLEMLLVTAGRQAPKNNRLQLVLENLRRVYGDEQVSAFLKRCAERGILT